MGTLVPLSHLMTGQKAEIGQLMGRPENVRRLAEMGLRDGTAVEMLRPGSPCIIRLGGQRICIRANELLSVLVRPGAVA